MEKRSLNPSLSPRQAQGMPAQCRVIIGNLLVNVKGGTAARYRTRLLLGDLGGYRLAPGVELVDAANLKVQLPNPPVAQLLRVIQDTHLRINRQC